MSTTETSILLDDLLADAIPEHTDDAGKKVAAVPETRVTTRRVTDEEAESWAGDDDRPLCYHTLAVGPKTISHEARWASEEEAREGHASVVALVAKVEAS